MDTLKLIDQQYIKYRSEWSDIRDHLQTLRHYSSQCSTIMEIGIRFMVSTFAVLKGLDDNNFATNKTYIGVDLDDPPEEKIQLAKKICGEHNINFNFIKGNDMDIKLITPVDLLFIDSLHTYQHLTFELEKFCNQVNTYICLHDTDEPWGFKNEPYHGDYSEYPIEISREKEGLLLAVNDFLKNHNEWKVEEHYKNSHGFTVLKRISNIVVK